jgi:hypothetical protein
MRRIWKRLRFWLATRAALQRQASKALDDVHELTNILRREQGEHRETRETLAETQSELAEAAAEESRLRGTLEVCKAQLEMYALWEARERERLEAEAAILAARRTLAIGSSRGAGDE